MFVKIVSTLVLIISLSACQSKYNSNQLQGKIDNDRFYDTNGWFSVSLPKNCLLKIAENSTSNLSQASFTDDLGNLMRFEIIKIPVEQMRDIKGQEEMALRCIFAELVFFATSKVFPDIKLIHSEYIGHESQLFAIINIPDDNIHQNLSTNQKEDLTRGYLLFFSYDKLIIISNQFSPVDVAIQYKQYGKNFDKDVFLKEVLSFKNSLSLNK